MNCRDAKTVMALHLGHDEAIPSEWEETRRHVSTCNDCRKHYRSLKQAMSALEQSDSESTYEVKESLWPEIQSRLSQQPGRRNDRESRSWTPFISFTVACLLFLAVWANPPQAPEHPVQQVPASARGMGTPFGTPTATRQTPHSEEDEKSENDDETNL